MTKRVIASCLVLTTLMISITGCGEEEEPVFIEEEVTYESVEEPVVEEESINITMLPDTIEPGVVIEASPSLYSSIDLTDWYGVDILLMGNKPEDWDGIVALANKYLKPYHTSINATFVGWDEYLTEYPAIIEGDEKYDLAFTAPWCFMNTEASNKVFYTIDTRFASEYMPLTYKYQISESWDETTLASKTIAVPSNVMATNGKVVAVRQDIADSLGIEEISSWNDYMEFLIAVSKEVTPKTGTYALDSAKNNKELWDLYRQQYDTFYAWQSGWLTIIYQYDGYAPEYDDLEFTYETDYFREFCYDTRKLNEANVWRNNALNGDWIEADSFADLTSASLVWNKTVFDYIPLAEANEGVSCEVYNITPDNLVPTESYSNNAIAILNKSPNPERAGMILDLLKNDTYLNHLFRIGVEGEHYTIDSRGNFEELPASEGYPFDATSISWAIRNEDIRKTDMDARKKQYLDQAELQKVACPTVTFVFDDSNVKDEIDAVNAILEQEVPKLELGLYYDVDWAIDNMIVKCHSAGLNRIMDEYQAQYESWLATR